MALDPVVDQRRRDRPRSGWHGRQGPGRRRRTSADEDRVRRAGSMARRRSNGSRARRSTRGGRPGGGAVTHRLASARPYTGFIASRRNPRVAKRVAKRSIVAGHHGLGAIQRAAPRPEIEAVELRVGDLAHAQVVGEVGRRGERAAVRDETPRAIAPVAEKRQRRHDDDWRAVVERAEPRADETHVVVERQPRHAHVVRRDRRRPRRRPGCSRAGWRATAPRPWGPRCCPTCTG